MTRYGASFSLYAKYAAAGRHHRSCTFIFSSCFFRRLPLRQIKNTISSKSLTRLKVYRGEAHDHAAQKPESWAAI